MAQCHPVEPFEPTCEKIEDYKERFDFYCTAHGIAEGKKSAIPYTNWTENVRKIEDVD